MLILARRLDQSIVIGDDITITVVDIRDGKVRLGIEAPSDIRIAREEILGASQLAEAVVAAVSGAASGEEAH